MRTIRRLVLLAVLALAGNALPESPGVLTVGPAALSVGVGGSVAPVVTANDRGGGGAVPVQWSSTEGRWSFDGGAATWFAPWTPGTYTLVARHPQDASAVAEVPVTVSARSVAPTSDQNAVPVSPAAVWPLGTQLPVAQFQTAEGAVLVAQNSFAPLRRLPNE